MVYDHAVKAYGKYYPAGAEVPEHDSPVSEPEVTADETEKPKRGRKSTQEKPE